jgi:hypothetical protein
LEEQHSQVGILKVEVNNMKLNFLKMMNTVSILFVLLALVVPGPRAAQAAPLAQQGTGGLSVNGAILDLQATPGLVFVHKMQVGVGKDSPAMEVTVEPMGFGESLSGEFQAVAAADDKNPYSARSYISAISKPSFHLNPGETVEVDATVTVPADPGLDTRYASILIKGTPQNASSVTQVLAVLVPVIITPQGAQMNKTGVISDFKINPVEAGKPIVVTTTVKNTGNRHFKVQGDVKIIDPAGQVVTDMVIPVTGTSIVPTFSRELVSSYSALEKAGGLAAGKYSAQVQINLEDGSPLDSKTISFEITKAYRPFPEIDEGHVLIKCYNNEEPGQVDARQATGVMVSFEGAGKGNGCVAVGLFPAEPGGAPRFTDSPDSGGFGSQAVKYVGIQVQGFEQGIAHISVSYTPNELNGADPNSLFLAVRSGGVWNKLDKLAVQTGAQAVLGDISVQALKEGPVQALGVAQNSGPLAAILSNPVLLVGAILIAVVVIVAIAFFGSRNKK